MPTKRETEKKKRDKDPSAVARRKRLAEKKKKVSRFFASGKQDITKPGTTPFAQKKKKREKPGQAFNFLPVQIDSTKKKGGGPRKKGLRAVDTITGKKPKTAKEIKKKK